MGLRASAQPLVQSSLPGWNQRLIIIAGGSRLVSGLIKCVQEVTGKWIHVCTIQKPRRKNGCITLTKNCCRNKPLSMCKQLGYVPQEPDSELIFLHIDLITQNRGLSLPKPWPEGQPWLRKDHDVTCSAVHGFFCSCILHVPSQLGAIPWPKPPHSADAMQHSWQHVRDTYWLLKHLLRNISSLQLNI